MDQKHEGACDPDLEHAIAQWENEGGSCCRDTSAQEEDEPPPTEAECSEAELEIAV